MENNSTVQYPPDSYLIGSIIISGFCCVPLGLYALVNSLRVENRFARGDYAGALEASNKAKKWIIISILLSVLFWALYIGFFFMLGVLGEL
tara:strand:- start:25 stop:297 length:273 start_codon:yes stop_codon:yes gene_type:complete